MEWLPLIILAAVLIFIGCVVLFVYYKLKHLARRALNMNLGQAADLISDGLKSECTTPKPITSLTNVYAPAINRDFPEVNADALVRMAENALVSSLKAVSGVGTPDTIADASPRLVDQVTNLINGSTGNKKKYSDIKIHKSGISEYSKTSVSAKITVESAIQYNFTGNSENGKKAENSLTQAAYRIYLAYNQESYLTSTSILYSSNCPNCGGPTTAIGDKKVCEYCGTGLKEISDRVWQADGFKQIN